MKRVAGVRDTTLIPHSGVVLRIVTEDGFGWVAIFGFASPGTEID
jgi:hypothetical protein